MNNKPLILIIGIAGILCLAAGLYQLSRNIRTVTVPSRVQWYDTGIDIPPGKPYKIIFESGFWTNSPQAPRTQALGRFGGNRKLLLVPGAYYCQLVAKIGTEKFATGNDWSGTSQSGGRLFLSMNDEPNTFQDNGGELEVTVEIIEPWTKDWNLGLR